MLRLRAPPHVLSHKLYTHRVGRGEGEQPPVWSMSPCDPWGQRVVGSEGHAAAAQLTPTPSHILGIMTGSVRQKITGCVDYIRYVGHPELGRYRSGTYRGTHGHRNVRRDTGTYGGTQGRTARDTGTYRKGHRDIRKGTHGRTERYTGTYGEGHRDGRRDTGIDGGIQGHMDTETYGGTQGRTEVDTGTHGHRDVRGDTEGRTEKATRTYGHRDKQKVNQMEDMWRHIRTHLNQYLPLRESDGASSINVQRTSWLSHAATSSQTWQLI